MATSFAFPKSIMLYRIWLLYLLQHLKHLIHSQPQQQQQQHQLHQQQEQLLPRKRQTINWKRKMMLQRETRNRLDA